MPLPAHIAARVHVCSKPGCKTLILRPPARKAGRPSTTCAQHRSRAERKVA